MALNPQERATTANQMMQILNNSGGGDISQLTERVTTLETEVATLETEVPVIAAQAVTNNNRITVLENKNFFTNSTIDPHSSTGTYRTYTITNDNMPELYQNFANILSGDYDTITMRYQNVDYVFYKELTGFREGNNTLKKFVNFDISISGVDYSSLIFYSDSVLLGSMRK